MNATLPPSRMAINQVPQGVSSRNGDVFVNIDHVLDPSTSLILDVDKLINGGWGGWCVARVEAVGLGRSRQIFRSSGSDTEI
ncbi:hypothetical protein GWI33_007540 [Rhynchophorus ferrugineus]|uniref:Uncharacterized protein n=1 Tax=Rhynchophorus ferrugineus TaxID=354439 RepID=A0A834IHF2_RHYFE|nr:hypothetical protein GWI33_007540 [Rhynchophorus ferrugineus]